MILTKKKLYIRGTGILSLLLGMAYFFGNKVTKPDPASTANLIIFEILFFSLWYFLLLNLAGRYLLAPFHNDSESGKAYAFFSKHPFAYSFLLLFIVWLPHMIFRYPAAGCVDVYAQIQQGMGILPLTTHHPVFHTELICAFLKFGEQTISREFGFFLYALVQNIIVGMNYSYVISFLVKRKASGKFIAMVLFFFGFCFFTAGQVSYTTKDLYYSAAFLLAFTLLAEYLLEPDSFFRNRKRPLLLVVTSVFMVLFRNNGKYALIPILLIFLISECKKKTAGKAARILLILSAFILSFAADIGVKAIYQPENGSIAEALSLPFQQTARLVKEKSEVITEEEREIINRILPYDELADLYDEEISDPVKARFNQNATTEDLLAYFKVWFKQFFRAPIVYFLATARQNIYLIYPGFTDYKEVPADTNTSGPDLTDHDYKLTSPDWKYELQEGYRYFWRITFESPLFAPLNNMPVYTILFLLVFIGSLNCHDGKVLLLSVPLFVCILIVIAAPCIRYHTRYIFPLIWSWPVWLGTFRIRQASLTGSSGSK